MEDLILVGLIILVLLAIYKSDIVENMSTATECRQSVEDIQKAFDLQKQEDQTNYNTASQGWQAKKNAIVSNFQGNPSSWPTLCGTPNLCDPVSSFFQVYENANLSGWNREETGGNDWETCLRKCRDRTDCQWVNWTTGGTCFINSLGNRQGSEHGFKTDRGYARYSNQYVDGYSFRSYDNSTPNQCQTYCDQDPGCQHWQVGSDNKCYLQNTGQASNMRVGIKKPSVGLSVPDYSPLIVNQIGQPPTFQRTPVPISTIICQDCSQQINNADVTDSKDVNFSQINQCIANLAANEVKAEAETKIPSQTPTPTTPTTTTPTTTPEQSKTTSETNTSSPTSTTTSESNKKVMYIIGGVVASVICIIIIISIVFAVKKNN